MNEQESVAFFPSLKEEVTVSLSSFPFLSEGIEILAVQFQSVSGARVPCATSSLLSGVVNIYEICWVFACELYAFTEMVSCLLVLVPTFCCFIGKTMVVCGATKAYRSCVVMLSFASTLMSRKEEGEWSIPPLSSVLVQMV